MVKFKRLDHIGMTTADIDRFIDFYTGILGFEVRERWKVEGRKRLKGVANLSLNAPNSGADGSVLELADGVRFQTSILTRVDRSDVGYMELVAGYWKEIGVEAEIEAVDSATYEGRRAALDFDGLKDFWAVGADYGQMASTLGQFRDDSSYRAGTFSDPVFEAKYDELDAAAGDAEEHRRLAKALDMYVIEQHPYIYGPRVPAFNIAQPWIVGYNGEMAIGNCAWNGPYARIWIDSQLKAELN